MTACYSKKGLYYWPWMMPVNYQLFCPQGTEDRFKLKRHLHWQCFLQKLLKNWNSCVFCHLVS